MSNSKINQRTLDNCNQALETIEDFILKARRAMKYSDTDLEMVAAVQKYLMTGHFNASSKLEKALHRISDSHLSDENS